MFQAVPAAPALRQPSVSTPVSAGPPQEVLVRFKDGSCSAERSGVLQRLKLQWKRSACRGTIEVVHLAPGQSAANAIHALSQAPGVLYAEPNQIAHALDSPDDPL